MPLITRRLLPAATLLLAFANAQTCYYPDGKTISNDIPCDTSAPVSSCCSSDSFCLADGLCYGGGLVTRGSCTDKSWGSPACAGYCRDVDADGEVAITPCTSGGSSNQFVCGVNTTDCHSDSNTFSIASDTGLVLRPNQIAALVGSALSTATVSKATVTYIPDGYYSSGALAGVALGIAVPLLFALAGVYMLYRREKRSKPKLMYKLPDDVNDDFSFKPPPTINQHSPNFSSNRASQLSNTTNSTTSRRGSVRTMGTVVSSQPTYPASFMERYQAMKRAANVQSVQVSVMSSPRAELASPTQESRYELADKRMSD